MAKEPRSSGEISEVKLEGCLVGRHSLHWCGHGPGTKWPMGAGEEMQEQSLFPERLSSHPVSIDLVRYWTKIGKIITS